MKILLFGGSGQLGFELQKRALDLNFELISPVISEVDIADSEQVRFLVHRVKPTVVINAAAYTAVDKAEEEREAAFKTNKDGARIVAEAAVSAKARLIHISTDYVFDGTLGRPTTEEDAPNPLNVYGESKLAGEREVERVTNGKGVILRTSSLHGQRGINFVHTMIELFRSRPVVRVVNDQTMSPTWAGWLSEVTLDLGRIECEGVVHACCSGAITWYQFAERILSLIQPTLHKEAHVKLEPISSEEFGRPARRPQYSVLDTTKLTKLIGRKPIPWEHGLEGHLKDLGILKS